jgi:DNA invertase Pin-like site-specific DNA recombinase
MTLIVCCLFDARLLCYTENVIEAPSENTNAINGRACAPSRMKRAAIYLRVSTGEQSVDNQRRELIEAAQRHGWQIVAEYSDAGISGAKSREKRRALFGVMGVFAEFERAMIVERTCAGLARARANGKRLGRPKIASDVEAAVRASLGRGNGIVRTAREIGVGVGTVQRIKQALA